MKKLQTILIPCLAAGLAIGCTPEDEHAVVYDLPDVELSIPANDGSAPAPEVSNNAPPPPPPPPGDKKKEDEPTERESTVSIEKLNALIKVSKVSEGDAGLLYEVQEAVENYYADNKALPPSFEALVESGHLERAPITPKGKKIRINGATLEVTIEESE